VRCRWHVRSKDRPLSREGRLYDPTLLICPDCVCSQPTPHGLVHGSLYKQPILLLFPLRVIFTGFHIAVIRQEARPTERSNHSKLCRRGHNVAAVFASPKFLAVVKTLKSFLDRISA
jgi:hypothetical protein